MQVSPPRASSSSSRPQSSSSTATAATSSSALDALRSAHNSLQSRSMSRTGSRRSLSGVSASTPSLMKTTARAGTTTSTTTGTAGGNAAAAAASQTASAASASSGLLPPVTAGIPYQIPTDKPHIHIKLSLPRARFEKSGLSGGLRVKVTARLVPGGNNDHTKPISFWKRGTVFDTKDCGGVGLAFLGIADRGRKRVRGNPGMWWEREKSGGSMSMSMTGSVVGGGLFGRRKGAAAAEDERSSRDAGSGDIGYLEFEDNFITLNPNQDLVFEHVFPAADLAQLLSAGESYTIYSRPDRERKKPAMAKCKFGTKEELATSAYWLADLDDEGVLGGDFATEETTVVLGGDADGEWAEGGMMGDADESDRGWVQVDVSHIVRDRDWMEIPMVVENMVRFHVV